MIAYYDNEPLRYEANGDGSYTYRWDINEVTIAADDESMANVQQWMCNEVVVWATVTEDKIKEVVITELWPNNYEQKLINDYNAYQLGVGEESAKSKYEAFLKDRARVKADIHSVCVAHKIPKSL